MNRTSKRLHIVESDAGNVQNYKIIMNILDTKDTDR